jgi:hypothetical protein
MSHHGCLGFPSSFERQRTFGTVNCSLRRRPRPTFTTTHTSSRWASLISSPTLAWLVCLAALIAPRRLHRLTDCSAQHLVDDSLLHRRVCTYLDRLSILFCVPAFLNPFSRDEIDWSVFPSSLETCRTSLPTVALLDFFFVARMFLFVQESYLI